MQKYALAQRKEECCVLFLPKNAKWRSLSGLIDWYLNSLISNKVQESKITLEEGEFTLLSPGPFLNQKQILVVGLGDKTEISSKLLQKTDETLQGLNVQSSWLIASPSNEQTLEKNIEKRPTLQAATLTFCDPCH